MLSGCGPTFDVDLISGFKVNSMQYVTNATNTNENMDNIQTVNAVKFLLARGVFSITPLNIVTNTKIMVIIIAILPSTFLPGSTKVDHDTTTHNPEGNI